MVCVALASGIAKEALKGKYVDVGHDLEDIIAQTELFKKNTDLHSLHTTFLGSLPSTGAMVPKPETPIEFPGPDF
jgi:hypothetical protein